MAILSLLQGCAVGGKIEEYTRIQQPIGTKFDVGVGGEIYTARREKSLPNAFGKADVFGRTTPSGVTTVVFVGLENESLLLVRRSVDIESGATTMNSTPLVLHKSYKSTHAGNFGGVQYAGTTTTQAPPTVIMPNTPTAQHFDKGAIPIRVPLKDLPVSIHVDGGLIRILGADPYKVTVEIQHK